MNHEINFETIEIGVCEDRPDCHTDHRERYAFCSCGQWRVEIHAGRKEETARREFSDHRISELEKDVAFFTRIHQLERGGA